MPSGAFYVIIIAVNWTAAQQRLRRVVAKAARVYDKISEVNNRLDLSDRDEDAL